MGTPRGLMEIGRGGACVPPASPCKGASIVKFPAHDAYVFGMETSLNSLHTMRVFFVMETPLRGRSGGHTGAAPTVSFGQIARGQVYRSLSTQKREVS